MSEILLKSIIFLLIFETHILFSKVEQFWKSPDYSPMFIQKAIGHSRGIWVLSNRNDITFTLVDSMPQCISFSANKLNSQWVA